MSGESQAIAVITARVVSRLAFRFACHSYKRRCLNCLGSPRLALRWRIFIPHRREEPHFFVDLVDSVFVSLSILGLFVSPLAAANPSLRSRRRVSFDGKSKTLITNGVVIVEGSQITTPGAICPFRANAQVIDLGRRHAFAGIHGRAHAPDLRFLGKLQ